jgi:hypothetical protein
VRVCYSASTYAERWPTLRQLRLLRLFARYRPSRARIAQECHLIAVRPRGLLAWRPRYQPSPRSWKVAACGLPPAARHGRRPRSPGCWRRRPPFSAGDPCYTATVATLGWPSGAYWAEMLSHPLYGEDRKDEQQNACPRHHQPQRVSPTSRSRPFDMNHSASFPNPTWARSHMPICTFRSRDRCSQ